MGAGFVTIIRHAFSVKKLCMVPEQYWWFRVWYDLSPLVSVDLQILSPFFNLSDVSSVMVFTSEDISSFIVCFSFKRIHCLGSCLMRIYSR